MPRQGKSFKLFQAVTANGVANPIDVALYNSLVVEVSTAGNAEGTLKFLGSISPETPDFSIPAVVGNVYTPIRILDLDSGVGINGGTGLVITGTDVIKQYRVNVDHLIWFTALLSGFNAGEFTVNVMGMANERLR